MNRMFCRINGINFRKRYLHSNKEKPMENMIITQDRDKAVNLRHVLILEVRLSKTIPGMWDIIANTSVSSDVIVLGSFSKKGMALDVRNDIILWNNQNFDWEWHIEYIMPQDNPGYQSTTDVVKLPAANRLVGELHKEKEKPRKEVIL